MQLILLVRLPCEIQKTNTKNTFVKSEFSKRFFYILGGSHGPVQWSREETRNQEVVRSNPGTRWTIFMLNCCKIWIIWLKRLKINKKRLGLARQKVVNLQLQLLFEEATTTMTTKTYQQSIFPCQNECKIMSENCVDSKKEELQVSGMNEKKIWMSFFFRRRRRRNSLNDPTLEILTSQRIWNVTPHHNY